MIFSSYSFIFIFFPVTLLGYHLLRRTGRPALLKCWLTAASLVFYGLGQPDFLPGFALTIVLNYLLLLGLRKTERAGLRRLWLTVAVVWNIGLLVYYKYVNFFLENVNWLFGTDIAPLRVLLPIGISFFTFQILAFTIHCYRGECELPSLLDYAAFVSFFPQLIVGPVVREEELMPQLRGDALLKFDKVWIYRGMILFSIGCAKKILLADPLIDYASAFYAGEPGDFSFVETWVAVFTYVFAYYFDFSGYIDMARGLGCFFGVELPVNFDSPYRARDFGDFWRRWNMTISRFFNDTVFSNLFRFGDGAGKLMLATIATFLVSGLWHGADWHFIAWGFVNGLLVCLANLRALKDRKPLPEWLAVLLTFVVGGLTRVLFDSRGMTQAFAIYRKLFDLRNLLHVRTLLRSCAALLQSQPLLLPLLLISAALCFFAPNANRVTERTDFTGREAVLSGVLLAASLFFMSHVSTFLYFNF